MFIFIEKMWVSLFIWHIWELGTVLRGAIWCIVFIIPQQYLFFVCGRFEIKDFIISSLLPEFLLDAKYTDFGYMNGSARGDRVWMSHLMAESTWTSFCFCVLFCVRVTLTLCCARRCLFFGLFRTRACAV